jgi:hypothetical protein
VLVFRPVRFPGPPAEPDVRLSPHPALHGFTPRVSQRLPGGCPWCRDARSPVAVPGNRDRAGVEQRAPVVCGGPPAWQVAAPQRRPRRARVSLAQPAHHPTPGVGVQVLEGGCRHAVTEVGTPAPQDRVEPVQQGGQLPESGSAGQRPDRVDDGGECLLRRVGVDADPVGAPLSPALDVPAEKVEALVKGDHLRLGRRQA